MMFRCIPLLAAASALVLIGSHAGMYRNTVAKAHAARWVSHTYEVLEGLSAVDFGLALAEASLRGLSVTVTGERDAIAEFEEGIHRIEMGIAEVARLTVDNPTAQGKVQKLRPRLKSRVEQLRDALSLARANRLVDEVTLADRLRLSREVRTLLAEMRRHERYLLARRVADSTAQAEQAERTALTGSALALLLSTVLFCVMWWQNKRIRNAEEELQRTIDNAPIGMAMVAPDGSWLQANDALCRILGYSREELLQTTFRAITHVEDLDADIALRQKLIAGDIPNYEMEIRYVRRDGRTVWARLSVSIARPRGGASPAFIAQVQDITETRQVEAQASVFFEKSMDLLAVFTPGGTFERANSAWKRTLGYDPKELIGRSHMDFVHPADRERTIEEAGLISERRGAPSFRNRYFAADGSLHWIEWASQSTSDGRVFCAARDVTESVQRERELNVFKRALAAARNGALMTDPSLPDNPITYVNPAFEAMTGYAAAELVGQSCRILQGSDREQPEITTMREAIASERECHVVLRNYKKSGDMFVNAVSISPVRDGSGRVTRYVGICEDITERVRTETALRDAKEAAEAAGRAKTTFLANMSHEIRTPLTALLGFADLMLNPKLDPSDRLNYALTIRRNGEHLLSVISDILDVSKVEAGKLDLEYIEFSPGRILSEISSLIRVRAKEKKLEFELEYESALPEKVHGDPTRLRQILLNLTSNAVKFTKSGSVRVIARWLHDDGAPVGELVVRVKDTGIGIDPATVSRLFQPFVQADASMTRRFGGSGLGLAISAPLARAMGGALDVDTGLNQGSTFTLRVTLNVARGTPMISEPSEAMATLGTMSQWEPADTSQVGGAVLLAEDGYDNQLLISTILRQQDFDVTVVENGALAVDRALSAWKSGEPFDVVLMDMQMPELDGYGATAQLRARGYDRPIIALTAHAMVGERERCLAAGCDEYLSKPIDRHVLLSQVSRYANKHVAKPEAAGPTQERLEADQVADVATPAVVLVRSPELTTAHGSLVPAKPELSQLVSELASDPEMASVVAKFVEGMPARMHALSDAASNRDRPLLARLAHQLKGAAGGYGFRIITKAAAQLEQQVKDPAADFRHALTELLQLCERTQVSSFPAVQKRPSAPSLLVIDDSPDTQELVAARLGSERVTMCSALTAREGLALAFESPPDVVLLDIDLPDMNGFEVCRELKANPRTAGVPVLFLTGTEDAAMKAAAFDLGAIDYVTKPFDPVELRARVRSALRTKQYQDLLTTRAQLDGLTGLWNRAYFDACLSDEVSAAVRYRHPLSVALLDLDHFKSLNDTYGHPFGDQVLQAFASALMKAIRASDVACRYGGEEFAVILRETPLQDALMVAERIRNAATSLGLTQRGERVRISVSGGVSGLGDADVSQGVESLARTIVANADKALYRAKREGRDRVVHDPGGAAAPRAIPRGMDAE